MIISSLKVSSDKYHDIHTYFAYVCILGTILIRNISQCWWIFVSAGDVAVSSVRYDYRTYGTYRSIIVPSVKFAFRSI